MMVFATYYCWYLSLVLSSCLWSVTLSSPINVQSILSSASSASSGGNDGGNDGSSVDPALRVAYQGEPGAYSECSTRELLGDNVVAIGRRDFESCYRAVVAMEVDYACLPIENSLGGSIHENYDLMLRYDLTIVAEHEFRVKHCLLVRPGVKKSDLKYAISHPQALAQCDNYFRSQGITPVAAYDTSGSAKMLSKDDFDENFANVHNANKVGSPEPMTAYNTCAIASDLAGRTYNLNCLQKSIEDDDSNFTRFLLLGRKEKSVKQHLTKSIPSKTSVVFTLPNEPGALYKALACFSLRDIDFSKIESRPTSASLLNFLKYKAAAMGNYDDNNNSNNNLPRFRFCFYLDILANELDETALNALQHLREQADFCRVLGSYPQKSRLVGPVKEAVQQLQQMSASRLPLEQVSLTSLASDEPSQRQLNIGIVGFGNFGQFLANKIVKSTHHKVSCIDQLDKSRQAENIGGNGNDPNNNNHSGTGTGSGGVEYHPMYDMPNFLQNLDVLILSVPLIHFEETVSHLPPDLLRGKLIVEVCRLSSHPKEVLLRHLPVDADIICSHPMFGPQSLGEGANNAAHWDNLPFVYENVRVNNDPVRAQIFLDLFADSRCRMVEMTAEQHDAYSANTQFVTHLTGRLLNSKSLLPPSPIVSPEYALLRTVAQMTTADSFDLFYGMYKFNEKDAKSHINEMRERLAHMERQLAAKEAYLAAKAEMKNSDRQGLLAECKALLQEVARSNTDRSSSTSTEGDDKTPVAFTREASLDLEEEAKKDITDDMVVVNVDAPATKEEVTSAPPAKVVSPVLAFIKKGK